LPRHR